jgi:hypothetical protein
MSAQGNALGCGWTPERQALKGRYNRRPDAVTPFQGYNDNRRAPQPRALPWAGVFRPFGASGWRVPPFGPFGWRVPPLRGCGFGTTALDGFLGVQ